MSGKRRCFGFVLMGLLLMSGAAAANPALVYGVGGRVRGMGGVGVVDSGGGAVFYNPAALAGVSGPVLGGGALFAVSDLDPGGGDTALLWEGTLMSPLPVGSWSDRLYVGVSFVIPHQHLYDFQMPAVPAPQWVGVGDSANRLALAAGLGVRIWRGLSVGLGVRLLPVVAGDVDVDLTDGSGDNRVRVVVDPRFRPVAGLLWRFGEGWRVGLSWRQGNLAEVRMPVIVEAAALDLTARVSGPLEWTPSILAVALEMPLADGLLATLQAEWMFFGSFKQTSPSVALYDSDGIDTLDAGPPEAEIHDAPALRGGVEWRSGRLALRAGGGWVGRVLDEQDDRTNLLDGSRYNVAAGGAWTLLEGQVPRRLIAGLDVQMIQVLGGRWEKAIFDPQNPGFPTLEYGGRIWTCGLNVKVEY